MILKENNNYTFCTQEMEGSSRTFTGAFIGYELLGTVTFIKLLSAVTGRYLLLNPGSIIWMECVNLNVDNEDLFEDNFDHVAVKEKKAEENEK